MPYIQPNTNNIFGLNPAEGFPGNQQTRLYAVSSSEADNILPGDAIVRTSLGTVRAAVTADTLHLIGAAAGPVTTSAYAQGTLNLLVYDDPDQHYVVTNTTAATMTIAMIGMNIGIVTTATGVGIPSTLVGRSKHAIGTAASSAGMLRIVALHPIETYSSAPTAGQALKWIVRPSPATDFVSNLTT